MEDYKLKEIREHIKKTRDGYGCDYIDCEYPEELGILKHYYFNVLKWCGCGSPSAALEEIYKYLKAIQDFAHRKERLMKYFGVEYVYDNHLLLCLAYALDATGCLTEHGSGIGGAWLQKDGEYLLYAIEKAKESGCINDIC